MLLRKQYLDDVGGFDERLFLYSEDLELSWRGRKRGWRYRCIPSSKVRHVHAATTGEGSALKDHFHERNHLLVLARHATTGEALHAAGRYVLVTGSYLRRDVVRRLVHGERPAWSIVGRRVRAFGAFLARAPGMRRSRRLDEADRPAPR